MRWRFAIVALVVAMPLQAQTIRWSPGHPNCHITAPHVDNPIDYSHYYTQPAVAWDAEYAALSLGSGVALRSVGVPAWLAAAVPTVGFGLVPHLLGYRRGMYNVSLHWAFVLWDRATPAFWYWTRAKSTRDSTGKTVTKPVTLKDHLAAGGVWLAGYAALACWDR